MQLVFVEMCSKDIGIIGYGLASQLLDKVSPDKLG